jgi:hypothetical protein
MQQLWARWARVKVPTKSGRPEQIKKQILCQELTPVILATQEAHGSKPAQGNSSQDTISKKPILKKGLVVWLHVCPEFKPQSAKKSSKQY